MPLRERREFIKVLRVLWQQEFTGHSKGAFSTGLSSESIAEKSGVEAGATKRMLWFMYKSGLAEMGQYDEKPHITPYWITPAGVDHYEHHATRWWRRFRNSLLWLLTIVATAVITALAMRTLGPTP